MGVTSASAGDLASRVQQAYRQTQVIEAEFVQKTFVAVLEREVTEKGRMILAKPWRFSIQYEGRRERRYLSDGKSLWIVRKGQEIERFDDKAEILSREALTFLGGLGEMEREFRVKEDSKRRQLELTPKDSRSPFSRIMLTIDPESLLAQEIELVPKNGNRTHYQFQQMKKRSDVSEDTFRP